MKLYFVNFSDDLDNCVDVVAANSTDEAEEKIRNRYYDLPSDSYVTAYEIDFVDGYKIVLEKIQPKDKGW